MRVSVEQVRVAFDELLNGTRTREEIADWAARTRAADEEEGLEFIPGTAQQAIWSALEFLMGVDLKNDPDSYLHTQEDFEEYWSAHKAELRAEGHCEEPGGPRMAGGRVVDLTRPAEEALARGDWNSMLLHEALTSLRAHELDWEVDWDEGAGESWASILAPEGRVALVHSKIPFAIVKSSHEALRRALEEQGCLSTVMGDFDRNTCTFDRARMARALGVQSSDLPDAPCSVDDLWFSTV